MSVEAAIGSRTVVSLSDVVVSYRRRRSTFALGPISLTVDDGRWLALIGPNGAGKSSLVKAIAGIVDHDGRIEAGGPVAYVAQSPVLPPGMTVAEYALLGRTSRLDWFEAEGPADRRIVDEVLARLSLQDFADRSITELSGGEVQRVSLARALVQQAPLLLLDEPTSALDIGHRIGVLELVDELRRERGLTVITAMHDLGTAARFADELVLLHHGRSVAQGPPAEVLTETTLSRYYQRPVQVLTGADGHPVVVALRDEPRRVANTAIEK